MVKNQEGSVALVSVIVISALLLISGVTLVLITIDVVMSTEDYVAKSRLQATGRTCLEESLFRVKADEDYTGQISLSLNGDTCTADVQDDGVLPNTKEITVSSSYEEYAVQLVHHVDIGTEPFTVID